MGSGTVNAIIFTLEGGLGIVRSSDDKIMTQWLSSWQGETDPWCRNYSFDLVSTD